MKQTIMKKFIYKLKSQVALLAIVFFGTALIQGCDDLLDAENPNSLVEGDLSNPAAAGPMANGSLSIVTRALTNIYAPYSTASDELTWIGSRDAWNQLQVGNIGDPGNEFTDAAFFFVGESRWWADEVIRRLEEFRADGALINDTDLARAYFYASIIYVTIGDMFDEFAKSDKRESGAIIGNAEMNSFYTDAIAYLTEARAIGVTGNLAMNVTGMLARAHHGLGVWNKLNPVNTGDPLVNVAAAVTEAQAAIALMDPDYKFKLELSGSLPGINSSTDGNGLPMPQQVNDRLEMRLSDEYVISTDGKVPDAIDDGDPATTISLMDPIDNIPDPALYTAVVEFTSDQRFADMTIFSAREMHLILAEAALAGGDVAGFTTNINNLRALDGLTDFSGQMDETELLLHSRRVNLFLQGRRLADHYRFDDDAVDWVSASDAVGSPGTFFPITIAEIRANSNLQGG